MILGNDIHPEKKFYYTAAIILEVLQKLQDKHIEYFELFENIRKQHTMTIHVFALSLDWLFLLGAIKHSQGKIEKCF